MRLNDIKVSDNFKLHEFECSDTNEVIVVKELVENLEKLRSLLNEFIDSEDEVPLIINRGYSTWEKHVSIYKGIYKSAWKSKITTDSLHLKGKAVDLKRPQGIDIDTFAMLAEEAGFDGIGTYNWGIHVDVRGFPARWDSR